MSLLLEELRKAVVEGDAERKHAARKETNGRQRNATQGRREKEKLKKKNILNRPCEYGSG